MNSFNYFGSIITKNGWNKNNIKTVVQAKAKNLLLSNIGLDVKKRFLKLYVRTVLYMFNITWSYMFMYCVDMKLGNQEYKTSRQMNLRGIWEVVLWVDAWNELVERWQSMGLQNNEKEVWRRDRAIKRLDGLAGHLLNYQDCQQCMLQWVKL